ncbi:MAG: hypothetical protein NTY50_03200 [Methylobacter sp.]|nr:hypothetical protein [Methylobacter sp.]
MTEGEVRDKTRDEIIPIAAQNKIDRDRAREVSRIHDNFKEFAEPSARLQSGCRPSR